VNAASAAAIRRRQRLLPREPALIER
jgi:hypothetical protein